MPLFKHKRLIAAAMLAVLAAVSGAALYVRPLSGELSSVTRPSGAERIPIAALGTMRHAAFPSNLGVLLPPLL